MNVLCDVSMRSLRCWSAMALLLAGLARAAPAPPLLEFEQRLGAALPLDVTLRDEAGHAVRLRRYFGREPVVLVLGYFHCPNLCSTVMDGVIEGLTHTGLERGQYRLVAVSIDPAETAAEAAARKAGYKGLLTRAVDASFLTGSAAETGRLAAAAGFPYRYDRELGQYLHPAGFLVATPDGQVARYFLGVRFDGGALGAAIVAAGKGRVGSLADRLLLLCAHFDPRDGRYSLLVMNVIRVVCLLLVAALGVWVWRRRAGKGAA